MKIVILTDTHAGARGDNIILSKYFDKFYYDVFFPYLEKHNITTMFHLGDIVEKRKTINYVTLRHLNKFVKKCNEMNLDQHYIVGNHDDFYKNTNEVNALKELYNHSSYKIKVYENPEDIVIDDTMITMMPWICSDNYTECMDHIQNTKSQVLMGHLEIQGFEMYRGSPNTHGLKTSVFNKFELVCSGHFHHRSSKGNISYLGSPFEIVWSDWNDPRGFHVFDTKTREIEYIENPYKLFHKHYYDDSISSLEELTLLNEEDFSDKYVKLIVKHKSNQHWFDVVFDKIENFGVIDLKIIEDHTLDISDDVIDADVEDTRSLLRSTIDELNTDVDKLELTVFMDGLYNKASSI